MTAIPDPPGPGRFLVPALAAADLQLDLALTTRPPCWAQSEDLRTWHELLATVRSQIRRLEALYAPWLCRFCLGFATAGDQPCVMCEASGLSAAGRQAYPFRFHHNGE